MAQEGDIEPGTVIVIEAWDRLGRQRPDVAIAHISAIALGAISRRLASRMSAPATPGSVFGMSKTVVTPPATAAAVRLPKSSFSGKPGSRPWTWASMAPGSTHRPLASTSSGLAEGSAQGSKLWIRPSLTWTSTSLRPAGV